MKWTTDPVTQVLAKLRDSAALQGVDFCRAYPNQMKPSRLLPVPGHCNRCSPAFAARCWIGGCVRCRPARHRRTRTPAACTCEPP